MLKRLIRDLPEAPDHERRHHLNSKIHWVKYPARGFRTKASFVTAIYLHFGGLDLRPYAGLAH
jgi:hypothetical protein